MNRKKWLFIVLFCTGVIILILNKSSRLHALHNHGQRLKTLTMEYEISWPFVMAMYVMECDGQKECPPIYHEHIFQELKKVQSREKTEYQGIYVHHVIAANDEALRDLATSWGPFQIKGYQVVSIGIPLSQLRTHKQLDSSVIWLSHLYGDVHIEDCPQVFKKHAVTQIHRGSTKITPQKYISQACKHMDWFAKIEGEL